MSTQDPYFYLLQPWLLEGPAYVVGPMFQELPHPLEPELPLERELEPRFGPGFVRD